MIKQLYILFFVTFGVYAYQVQGQDTIIYHPENKPTTAEKSLDNSISGCLKSEEAFEQDFSFAEWTSTLHYYTRKMLRRMDTEHTLSIAEQKPRVLALAKVAQNCKALNAVKADLQAMQKIYDNDIKIEKSESNNDLFGEQEEVEASLDTGAAASLLKRLEKLRKKLNITRVVIQIK